MDPKYMYPNPTCPVPLKEDFWKVLVGREDAEKNTVSLTADPIRNDNVAAEVGRIMSENSNFINKTILKEIAPTATNVEGNQYTNLINLSFDQDRLIGEEEKRRRRQREKVLAKILR